MFRLLTRQDINEELNDFIITEVDEMTRNEELLEVMKPESEKEIQEMQTETQKLKDKM